MMVESQIEDGGKFMTSQLFKSIQVYICTASRSKKERIGAQDGKVTNEWVVCLCS